MPTFRVRCRLAFLALAAVSGLALHAAPAIDVVAVDLQPLIDRAAESPIRFAVDIPHAVSPATGGQWSSSGDTSTWTYSVQIPGAVSMSFHASNGFLPTNVTLTVSADGTDYVYTAKDMPGGDFWSRIGRGDLLTLTIRGATQEVDRVRLDVASLQAGYRSLGAGVQSHPYYDDLRKRAFATPMTQASCAENWTCDVTATNAGAGDATAAVIVSNSYLCTGVLLNDVPGDGTPYLLTARHCQNGNSDGGLPSAAASIVVYWNAVAACGTPLGNVYDAGTIAQYGGADTIVEQQDTWLVRLRQALTFDAYFAGWDATGGTFIGGFTPHHANGTSRQFVGWYGQAAYFTVTPASLGVKYTSTFWGTVNVLGAAGPGSSGGGLFNDTGHLVGTIARGLNAADGTGMCPLTVPPVPSQANPAAESTAFSGVFSSTADPGSTTGAVTLQSVLDPAKTGTLVLDGKRQPLTVTLRGYTDIFPTGTHVSLDWSTTALGVTCTAGGGEAGDGWAGSVPGTGSKTVTSFDGGNITYTVTCSDGQRTGSASVTLHWTLAIPALAFSGNFGPDFGVPFSLNWDSNVRPCTASGGSAGDGWGGPVNPLGSATVTETVVGAVTFTVACGSGARAASQQLTVNVVAPSVSVVADAKTLRLGETVNISTSKRGIPCVKTGGLAGDGWAGTVPNGDQFTLTSLTERTPGTYVYAMACGSGSHIATSQVTVTFSNVPAAVSLQLSSTTAALYADIGVTWDSNVRDCRTSITGPVGTNSIATGGPPVGSTTVSQSVIGQYVFDITCGSGPNTAHASAAVSWTGTPSVQLQAPTDAVRGASFYLIYFTNVLPCTASGATASGAWAGQFSEQSRSLNAIEPAAGTKTYTLTCGSGSQTASNSITVNIAAEAPKVTLTATPPLQLTGLPVTLSWSTNTASSCQAYGGSGNDGWSGTQANAGSLTVTEHTGGNYAFTLVCGTGDAAATGVASLTVADLAAPMLTVSTTAAKLGDTVTLNWASGDGSTCFATGGPGIGNWYGAQPATGSLDLPIVTSGQLSFSLTCGASLPATVVVNVKPIPTAPFVTLAASQAAVTVGTPFTLSWTVSGADSCTASGGAPGDGWSGDLASLGGSHAIQETQGGVQLSFTITCFADGLSTMSSVMVTIAGPASPAATGGGGGSIGPVDLAFFSALAFLGWWRRRREAGMLQSRRASFAPTQDEKLPRSMIREGRVSAGR